MGPVFSMNSVCLNCHSPVWVDDFFAQYNSAIGLYNKKYCTPARAMLDNLYENNSELLHRVIRRHPDYPR